MEAAYEKGLALLRAGEFFAAHEALEEAWRAAPADLKAVSIRRMAACDSLATGFT